MNVKAKGIRVWVVLEFDNVENPDCPEADEISENIHASTDWLSDEFKASRCYVSDICESLWVDESKGVEK